MHTAAAGPATPDPTTGGTPARMRDCETNATLIVRADCPVPGTRRCDGGILDEGWGNFYF